MARLVLASPLTDAEIVEAKAYFVSQGESLTQVGTNPRMWQVTYKGKTDTPFTDDQLVSTINLATGPGNDQFTESLLHPGTPTPAGQAAIDAGSSAISGVESVGDFLGKLSNPNLWIRVGEFAIGGILLGIAINGMLKNPGGKVGAVAKTAVFPAKAVSKAIRKE